MLLDGAKQKMFMYYPTYALEKLAQFSEGTTTRWNPDIDAPLLYLLVPALTSWPSSLWRSVSSGRAPSPA
jgi:hypothetical protein